MPKKDKKIKIEKKPANSGSNRNSKGQFIKGFSGNPEGPKPGYLSIVKAIKRKLEEVPPKDKKNYLDQLVQVIFDEAINNKSDAQIRNILQYAEGMPKQAITHGSDEENPVKIEINYHKPAKKNKKDDE